MLIRPLEPSDSLEEMTRLLHRAYARLGAMGLNYTAVSQTPETTAQRLRGGACFVAESEGRLVGTVVVHRPPAGSPCAYFTRDSVATLRQLGVDPLYHGKGIGGLLLASCEAWAREAGFSELALDTAEPARHLLETYERWGFRRVGTVQWDGKVYRSIVLAKTLTPGPSPQPATLDTP
jgi:GNAT superfamily N-acetyltransferase